MEEKIINGDFKRMNLFTIFFGVIALFGLFASVISSIQVGNVAENVGAGIAFIIVGGGLALLFHNLFDKCALTVTSKRVYGEAAFGRKMDLPLDKVSAVATCAFSGVVIATSSGRIKFRRCKNKEEVFNAVSALLMKRQASPAVQTAETNTADELKKYKDLLDSGVITQAEFDAKKKQLLGL